MAISLFDISVPTWLQVLGGVDNVLTKGAAYAADNDLDLAEVVERRLREDMNPFRFQVISCRHHSMGALEGLRRGEFNPPPSMDELDYAGLHQLVKDAIGDLQAVTREEVEGFAGNTMYFRMGDVEIPFIAENFILSFSLPNFYFHATTTYDMLRVLGVPLGKMDFLGQMRMGA